MIRGPLLASLLMLTLALSAPGAEAPPGRFDRVDIAPARTSIYIGSVTLTMPAFTRRNGIFESTYTAKVFPYFFYNEKGRLLIDVSEEALGRLARGESIEFTGRGIRDGGDERRVEGKATPFDATSGKIKVRVYVSPRTELIFNTTYRFAPEAK